MKKSLMTKPIIFYILFILAPVLVATYFSTKVEKCERPSVVYVGSSARTGSTCVVLEYKDGSKESFCPRDEDGQSVR